MSRWLPHPPSELYTASAVAASVLAAVGTASVDFKLVGSSAAWRSVGRLAAFTAFGVNLTASVLGVALGDAFDVALVVGLSSASVMTASPLGADLGDACGVAFLSGVFALGSALGAAFVLTFSSAGLDSASALTASALGATLGDALGATFASSGRFFSLDSVSAEAAWDRGATLGADLKATFDSAELPEATCGEDVRGLRKEGMPLPNPTDGAEERVTAGDDFCCRAGEAGRCMSMAGRAGEAGRCKRGDV